MRATSRDSSQCHRLLSRSHQPRRTIVSKHSHAGSNPAPWPNGQGWRERIGAALSGGLRLKGDARVGRSRRVLQGVPADRRRVLMNTAPLALDVMLLAEFPDSISRCVRECSRQLGNAHASFSGLSESSQNKVTLRRGSDSRCHRGGSVYPQLLQSHQPRRGHRRAGHRGHRRMSAIIVVIALTASPLPEPTESRRRREVLAER